MQKLVRLLIIYTAITSTLLLVITFLSIRGSMEQNKKAENTIDRLQQELAKITTIQQSQKEIIQKLDSLSSKMAPSTSSGQADNVDKKTLGASKVLPGFVIINDKKWQTVDVYENNSYSSKVIGKIEFDKVYFYIKKVGSWYEISLPGSKLTGWVAGRFLEEIEDNGPKE